jgi:hypothetical protein
LFATTTPAEDDPVEQLAQRRPGLRSGVRPNHWMPGRDHALTGQLDFLGREWLKPGEQCAALGILIVPEQDRDRLVPGFAWQVEEGSRIVGRCTLSVVLKEGDLLPETVEQP